MPKTDVTEERGLSRLQGIDLREHADQNTAHDCVNLRLDNASRLTNYPRPTKVRSGVFTFACESKNPSLQEFDFALDGYFGSPTVTTQETYSGGTMTKINGTNLGSVYKVLLIAEDGTCLESGQDFYYDYSGTSLLLNVYWSEYAKYESGVLYTPYGVLTFTVDITVRTSKTLYIGNRYKLGVDSESLEFCIWQRSGTKWTKLAAYGSPSATPWIEGAELKDERTDGICLSFSGEPCWAFFAVGSNLALGYASQFWGEWGQLVVNTNGVQTWGNASGTFDPYEAVDTATTYTFGTFETYRLRATNGNSLILEMKSNSETNTYDITLNEWHYEQ